MDKEFYDLQNQFEKDIQKELMFGHVIKRETKNKDGKLPGGYFYTDGAVNSLFQAYRLGYENAKCLARLDAI